MISDDVENIEKSFTQLTASIPASLSGYLKSEFEKFLPEIIGRNSKVEVHLVLDASQAISELISYTTKGKSVIIELAKEPFLKLYAPPKIQSEVEEAIPEIASKRKLDGSKLLEVWQNVFSPIIRFSDTEDLIAIFRGHLAIGKRDPEDIPYVALSFTTEMHGIITRDADISDQPSIRTWKLGRVRQVITVMKRGSFSFFISSKLLIPLMKAFFELLIAFLRAVFNFAVKVAQLFVSAIASAAKWASRLPDWAQLLLLLAAIGLMAYEKTRNEIIGFLRAAAQVIGDFLNELYQLIKKMAEPLAPIVQISVATMYVVFKGMNEAVTEIRSL